MATIDLDLMGTTYTRAYKAIDRRVIVCAGTGCIANGALEVYERLKAVAAERGVSVTVSLDHDSQHDHPEGADLLLSQSGCQGFCQVGPLVSVEPDGILYVRVSTDDIEEIVDETLAAGRPVERLL